MHCVSQWTLSSWACHVVQKTDLLMVLHFLSSLNHSILHVEYHSLSWLPSSNLSGTVFLLVADCTDGLGSMRGYISMLLFEFHLSLKQRWQIYSQQAKSVQKTKAVHRHTIWLAQCYTQTFNQEILYYDSAFWLLLKNGGSSHAGSLFLND